MKRVYLDARYDITDLTEEERACLAMEVQVAAEARKADRVDDEDGWGDGSHPSVEVELEWNEVEIEPEIPDYVNREWLTNAPDADLLQVWQDGGPSQLIDAVGNELAERGVLS